MISVDQQLQEALLQLSRNIAGLQGIVKKLVESVDDLKTRDHKEIVDHDKSHRHRN